MAGGAYAFMPLPESPDHVRFFAGGRDAQGRSRIGVVTVEWGERPRVVDVTADPVLDLGEPGCFDMDGVSYPWIVRRDTRLMLYFTGWTKLGREVPFANHLGLAISDDDGRTFSRVSRAPLLPLTDREPIGTGSCAVVQEDDSRWTMYYTRLLSWDTAADTSRPRYNIWHATSTDGRAWRRLDRLVIGHDAGEYALGAPSYYQWDQESQLYFTARGHRYRLFVARQQEDGAFRRLPGAIRVVPGDWDDEMQCYPRVLTLSDRRILFYCGNGYGRSGVGYAEWAASVL
jgi:hypothetical protein